MFERLIPEEIDSLVRQVEVDLLCCRLCLSAGAQSFLIALGHIGRFFRCQVSLVDQTLDDLIDQLIERQEEWSDNGELNKASLVKLIKQSLKGLEDQKWVRGLIQQANEGLQYRQSLDDLIKRVIALVFFCNGTFIIYCQFIAPNFNPFATRQTDY